jgi:carboxyl-terminal processing protease
MMRFLAFVVFSCLLGSLGEAQTTNESPSPSSVCGIGAVLTEREGNPVITNVLPNSPALKAGLIPYDQIVQVDGKKVDGLKLAEVVKMIRGPAGTVVKIFVVRAGQHPPESFEVTRAVVQLWSR